MDITMKEIAKKAGVSRSAVSKVLSSKDSVVKEDTRKKILQVAEELNYRPNYFATSLKTRKTNCIGLLSSHAMTYESVQFVFHYSQVTAGIAKGLVDEGNKYSLITFGTSLEKTYRKSLELVQRRIVDGLILIVMSFELEQFQQTLLPFLERSGIPFVVIHSTSRELPYNNVGIDTTYTGYVAAEHFIKLGHRDAAMYMNKEGSPRLQELAAGFYRALREYGLAGKGNHIIHRKDIDITTVRDFSRLPSALFIPDDYMARDLIGLASARGRAVPGDLAVIGFNDIRMDHASPVALTTFHHPLQEKGMTAARILTGILDGKLDGTKIHREILRPKLMVRKTCGFKKDEVR